ncbi:DNA topology modulation protein [Bacillus infantis]|uniref:DNA topology modulation protein n=1 Tax=Bacillus infantis TaxID=324767 RepID=A0A5D4SEZ8_9BACI|nr:DNA topology modulation protein [Bacillus infantis]TYS60552.1 DNA topology modulation protein [Bacillus infantis]
MKRIIILGSGGSGKSTFAVQLGHTLDIPVTHLDALYWGPGWVKTPEDEWQEKQKKYLKEKSWIIDGNFSSSLDLRIKAADTIIFLDLPRYICLFRALKRSLRDYGKTRPDMGEGCREKFDLKFLKWVWNFPQKGRKKIINRLNSPTVQDKTIIHLRSPRSVENFLKNIPTKQKV